MATNLDLKTPGQIINGLQQGMFAKLCKVTPSGSLEARKLSNGVMLYWRVTIGGKTERVAIGNYDSTAAPKSHRPTEKGFSIQAAIRAPETLAQRHHDNRESGGHRALVEAEAEAKRKAAEDAAEARQLAEVARLEAERYTLHNLLIHYCDYLEALGRRSHKDARSIFKIHVFDAWPNISALPANQVTGEQIADMMRRLLELEKGRTANKLRSYVRAAYQVALSARSKASVPLHFKAYRVSTNPGADTVPDESQNNPDKRPLSAKELQQYWRSIKGLPGFKGAVLRLHLLTGGQRIEQLVNLRTCNLSSQAITLYDGKGRPGRGSRPHTVPLIPLAAAALTECAPQGEYALSTDSGETHLAATTLSRWAVDAGQEIAHFATKRIRSGVETLLASARISADIRGRLQSHGISGVQARHYDGHDYMDEKRQCLQTLLALLETQTSQSKVHVKGSVVEYPKQV